MVNVKGSLDPDFLQFEGTDEIAKGYREEFERVTRTFFSNLTPEKSEQLLEKYGLGYVEVLLQESKGMQQAMEALLSSVVTDSWTTFETLASDLWAVGVDNGPPEITARLILASKSFKNPDDNIGAAKAHEIGVNPRTHMGTFLRGTGKVTFQRLRDTQAWYGTAFGKHASRLFDEVADGYVFAHFVLRNVLIHNAGKADPQFVKHAQRFPELRKFAVNEQIFLDGELVGSSDKHHKHWRSD